MLPLLRWSRFVLLLVIFLALPGCSGCNRTTIFTAKKEVARDDPLLQARNIYGTALHSGTANAATFRDANKLVNDYLATAPDALTPYQPGAADRGRLQGLLARHGVTGADGDERALYLKFLENVVGLDASEVKECEGTSLQLLDAHYLEMCFLLRSIALSMPFEAADAPLTKAEYCFRWVMRQAVLHQSRDEMLPPQFVLRRGSGNAAERAWLFLSLIQQFDLDGCVLALPGPGPVQPWLVGVLLESQGKADVYLFDPRLGIAVPGPDGKGIATLAQLRSDPNLVNGLKAPGDELTYDVDAKQAAGAAIYLSMPLSALSARIKFLDEKVLQQHSLVYLALRPLELMEKFEALKAGPVHVWNARPEKAGAGAVSPTRALRQFLPVEEGGTDTGRPRNRLQAFQAQLFPLAAFTAGLTREQLGAADVPFGVQDELRAMGQALWQNYAQTPHQQLVRGRLDDCTKRLVHIQTLLDAVSNEDLTDEIKEWRERVVEAYGRGSQAAINGIWSDDPRLVQILTDPEAELSNTKQMTRKALSNIVLRAMYDPLRLEAEYLLALRWQEKAERTQALLDKAPAGGAAQGGLAKDAHQKWDITRKHWTKFAPGEAFQAATIKEKATELRKFALAKQYPLAVELLEYHAGVFRQAAAARLMQIEALVRSHDKAEAERVLKELSDELAKLEKNADLQSLRSSILGGASPELRSALSPRIDKVYADLGPQGSLYWVRYTAAWHLARMQKSKG